MQIAKHCVPRERLLGNMGNMLPIHNMARTQIWKTVVKQTLSSGPDGTSGGVVSSTPLAVEEAADWDERLRSRERGMVPRGTVVAPALYVGDCTRRERT